MQAINSEITVTSLFNLLTELRYVYGQLSYYKNTISFDYNIERTKTILSGICSIFSASEE